MSETWFLLFDGSSPDGRGFPEYVGRTTDAKAAKKHFTKCHKNPYSTGSVFIVTDHTNVSANPDTDWDSLT